MDIAVIPATINPVEKSLISIDPRDISSPNAPGQTFVIDILYITVNRALVPVTDATKEAGPGDKAKSNMISPTCAVMKSFIATKSRAGLRFENRDLTSAQGSALKAKHRKINAVARVLKPCVYRTGNSSSAILPITMPVPNRNAENIRE